MRGEGWEGGAFCWAPIMAICGVQFQSGTAVSFIVFSDRKNSSILWRDILHLAIKEIQVIITMILLTRYSERIFTPRRYTGTKGYKGAFKYNPPPLIITSPASESGKKKIRIAQ